MAKIIQEFFLQKLLVGYTICFKFAFSKASMNFNAL